MPITPDTKDWTWVLNRPCDECAFNAENFAPGDFARVIDENATRWVAVLSRPDVGRRRREDQWSPLEYACHVRDVYRIFDERLTLMLTLDDPKFQNWDQDEAAVTQRYESQDPSVVSEELVAAATRYADRFRTVAATQWQRPGTRSNGSRFTVATLGSYSLHDVIHHVWDVTSKDVT